MKKIILSLSLVISGALLFSCEKEAINVNQADQSRILSSNPDEYYVQDPTTGNWITMAEYNNLFTSNEKAVLYGKRLCVITNSDGTKSNGEVCARVNGYSNCSGQGACLETN